MNQVSERGVCFPEDINKNEDQTKSGGSIENSDTSHSIHVSCGRLGSSEISMQSIVKLYVASVKEDGEPLNCNVNISVTQKQDVIAGINEVVEEAKNMKTYQKRKRLKMTHSSDLPTNDLEITKEDTGSSSHGLQPFEIESVTSCCYESMSEKRLDFGDRITVAVVGTNKLLEKDLDSVLGFHETSSNNDDKLLIVKSNENASENCDTNMLALAPPESRTENAIVPEAVPNEMENDEMNRDNLLEEVNDEARKTVSNVEACDAELQEENIGNFQRVSSGDSLGSGTQLHPEEHSVASDADISFNQLDDVKGFISQVVTECIDVAVDRAFAGYTGKKLLVLDVNGLLVDISSYVPYDYDPDDIIRRKAVFKRPYCDDFLKFCFERFNVGVWTSRTKRNMEPILDFLLGKDKCKLLFCWDQSHCTDTGFTSVEKRYKPLLLKKLKKLWNKCEPDLPWERGVYNESNTLLLDDTPSKALSNPRYNAVFPKSYRFRDVRDNSIGPGGDLRVYLEGLALAENVQEYVKQNPFGQRAITEKNLSWGYYLKVIEASSTPPRQTEEDDMKMN